MSDLISKRELYHKLGEAYNKGFLSWGANEVIKDIIGECNPVENKGEWMLLDECSNSGYYCSRCHKKVVKEGWSETVKKIKFCPNCGADMRKAEKTETCKGCLEPCIMYEPDMRACKKKVKAESEDT